jgi:predicted Zn-dependent peptidase
LFCVSGLLLQDDRRYAFQLLSSILGGGMSSRLFQTLREKLGLCYSIYSFIAGHNDTGVLGISTALGQETENEAISAKLDEVEKLRDNGVTEDELARACEQVKANVILGLESTSARMHRLGKNELCFGSVPSTEDIIRAYNEVTCEDIIGIARETFDYVKLSLSAVGKVKSPDEYRAMTLR